MDHNAHEQVSSTHTVHIARILHGQKAGFWLRYHLHRARHDAIGHLWQDKYMPDNVCTSNLD